MKLALPLFLLSAVLALAAGKRDDNTDTADLETWNVNTKGMKSCMVTEFDDDIKDCIKSTHTHDAFNTCINNHLAYYDSNDLSSQQKTDIRNAAEESNVHKSGGHHGHHHRNSLRGLAQDAKKSSNGCNTNNQYFSGNDLQTWNIKTDGMKSGMEAEFDNDIHDCIQSTHNKDMFLTCIRNHLAYYGSNDMSTKQKNAILSAAEDSNVYKKHGHGHHHRNSMRGL